MDLWTIYSQSGLMGDEVGLFMEVEMEAGNG